MSVDIRGENREEMFFNNAGWAFLLNFAEAYGWNPAGTLGPPDRGDWDGNYDLPEGQTISAIDANEMASAITDGLADPNRVDMSRAIAARISEDSGATMQPFNFSDRSIRLWLDFVRIAKAGSFVIF